MSKYISVVDTAKMIRVALKEAFPGIKFSVKSSSYSGGASIRIEYLDGPSSALVDAVVDVFNGSYFDGMIDYKGSCFAEIDGEEVRFCADFIFVNQKFSDARIGKAIDKVYKKFAGNFAGSNAPRATVEDYKNGNLYGIEIPKGRFGPDDFRRELYSVLNKMSDRIAPNKAPSVEKIKYLGSDGYGNAGVVNPRLAAGGVNRGYPSSERAAA